MFSEETKTKLTNFSIRNFIADLPRMLNEAFGTLCDIIFSFYDKNDGNIVFKNISRLESTFIEATTVVAQNLRFKGTDGKSYDLNNIGIVLSSLESQIKELQLKGSWPLYADYYMSRPTSNITEGCKVLVTNGIDVYINGAWETKPVSDGATYLCGNNNHVYKRNESLNENLKWVDLGEYKTIQS